MGRAHQPGRAVLHPGEGKLQFQTSTGYPSCGQTHTRGKSRVRVPKAICCCLQLCSGNSCKDTAWRQAVSALALWALDYLFGWWWGEGEGGLVTLMGRQQLVFHVIALACTGRKQQPIHHHKTQILTDIDYHPQVVHLHSPSVGLTDA